MNRFVMSEATKAAENETARKPQACTIILDCLHISFRGLLSSVLDGVKNIPANIQVSRK